MYEIVFYEDMHGRSELLDYLSELESKAGSNKNARIQYRQLTFYIQLLSDHGTRLNENITKHLQDGIWELRPGDNRVLYFYDEQNVFVLLHAFRKKTRKTPAREIKRALTERADYLSRRRDGNENLGRI